MDTKFIQVGPVSRIQLSAAVILWIGVVIRDSLAAQERPVFTRPGNLRWRRKVP